jgi:hypothetical protein
LDAQRQYQQALLGYVGARAQRYQDSIQLMVAMGGGGWAGNPAVAAGHIDSSAESGGHHPLLPVNHPSELK